MEEIYKQAQEAIDEYERKQPRNEQWQYEEYNSIIEDSIVEKVKKTTVDTIENIKNILMYILQWIIIIVIISFSSIEIYKNYNQTPIEKTTIKSIIRQFKTDINEQWLQIDQLKLSNKLLDPK